MGIWAAPSADGGILAPISGRRVGGATSGVCNGASGLVAGAKAGGPPPPFFLQDSSNMVETVKYTSIDFRNLLSENLVNFPECFQRAFSVIPNGSGLGVFLK